MVVIGAFLVLVFLYSLTSRRLERTIITAPILFTAGGILLAFSPEVMRELDIDRKEFLLIAEIGLVMTLFTDASRVAPRMLSGATNLPIRLLTTGMLLTIALGALCALLLGLSWWEAGILSAILAPTDAGLGQVIVNSPLVPQRIRQALNVEAGLNDGLSVPFMLFFVAAAVAVQESVLGSGILGRYMLEQLGYGTLIGLAVGLAGGWLIERARRSEWMTEPMMQLGVVTLPLVCVLASEASAASMFIAAFVAGMATQVGFRDVGKHSVEFAEEWGQLFDFFVFFLFGLVVAGVWRQFTWDILLYAVLSLTLVRMVPVAIALKGTGLNRETILFMGWFGPRGLASIVLGLVLLEMDHHLPGETTIKLAVMATVLLSIFVHGFSALPGTRLYAKAIEDLPRDVPEHQLSPLR
jgi:sodium/hydrogen antiporter